MSDSLLAKEDRLRSWLRSFLAAWTSLEIFINKFSSKPSKLAAEEATESRKVPVYRFNSAGDNVGLEDREAREISFKKIKAIRDKLIHRAEDSQPRFRHVPVAAANQLNSPQRTQEAVQSRKRQGEIFRLVDPEMQCENMHIDAAPFILAIHHADTAGCGFYNRVAGRQNTGLRGQKTHGTRGALSSVEV